MNNRFEPQEAQDQDQGNEAAHRLLKGYLERICTPDSASTASQVYDELREEMSEHILALAAVHQELGTNAEEAMRAALKQFGEEELIEQAVSREIGTQPSFFGSPHTVSMIGGVLINWATLCGANYLVANTEIGAFGPGAYLLGIVVGCVSGSVVWKKRRSLHQAMLWNARFYAGATVFSLGALLLYGLSIGSRFLTLEWLRLAGPVLLQWIAVATVAGAFSGALTSLWCRCVRKQLTDMAGEPRAGRRRLFSA